MKTTNKSGVALFIEECYRNGMRNVVCSPGSRNAPLIIALDEHPEIETVVIHDERSAGFFAMGMAQRLKEPVGVVCTSGSAVLNYFPAVAEAFYQSIPLIVISADRPNEWINHGDGQTIMQENVFGKHVHASVTIDEYVQDSSEKNYLIEKIDSAFSKANHQWKGPIHFNVPVSEPLYEMIEKDFSLPAKNNHSKSNDFHFSEEEGGFIEEKWSSCAKKMILCGQMDKNGAIQSILDAFSNDSSVVVIVENTSNLRGNRFVHCIDRTLTAISDDLIEDFQPDLLITIGGAIVSKRIKTFLRESTIKEHWNSGYSFPEMNTFRKLTKHFNCTSLAFLVELEKLNLKFHSSSFGNKWKQLDVVVNDKLQDYNRDLTLSDLKVVEVILDFIPENSILHMGNSSIVRYCQLFDPILSVDYYSNRGTSGIDGCSSTAAGIAHVSVGKLNVLITGDVSFLYDSNALWNDYLSNNLCIIVVNNQGGGIFKIIDGPQRTNQLEKYFVAKHNYSAANIADAFNIEYSKVNSLEELENEIPLFYQKSTTDRPKILEVFTSPELNDVELKKYFEFIKRK